jgi:hypothetical protein
MPQMPLLRVAKVCSALRLAVVLQVHHAYLTHAIAPQKRRSILDRLSGKRSGSFRLKQE